MDHLEKVHARWADPSFMRDNQKRADQISDRLSKSNLKGMAQLLQAEPTKKGKTIWLNQIISTLEKATQGIVPCRDGCSYCCNMAVEITTDEAQRIAAATGRQMFKPLVLNKKTVPEHYEGKPCPLLVDNRCSAYAVRPFACKVHYSVDADNLLCQIVPGKEIRSPNLNTMQFTLLSLMTEGEPETVQFADIREFFR